MAMGTRKRRERQEGLWYGGELPTAPGHPFYKRLNEVLDNARFDPFAKTTAPVSITISSAVHLCLQANISGS
jgi:hypothetical protein